MRGFCVTDGEMRGGLLASFDDEEFLILSLSILNTNNYTEQHE
jgi:hypothetical protein